MLFTAAAPVSSYRSPDSDDDEPTPVQGFQDGDQFMAESDEEGAPRVGGASLSEAELYEEAPPVASEGRLRNPPRNRGKKGRQPDESMPVLVWVPTAPKKGRWLPVEDLEQVVRTKLTQAFQKLVMKPASRKSLWARWQDPVNREAHYGQCIGHGLIAKAGQVYASHHQACEWCIKRGQLCAFIHEAQVDFIGILPLESSIREGFYINDVEFWLSN